MTEWGSIVGEFHTNIPFALLLRREHFHNINIAFKTLRTFDHTSIIYRCPVFQLAHQLKLQRIFATCKEEKRTQGDFSNPSPTVTPFCHYACFERPRLVISFSKAFVLSFVLKLFEH
ncbi:hypothetical protein OS493_022837 [Desmophyllum pertusum]|uniref:Uncharacterized protein n=1 Tax=Desmophyllum pertusum TaxID=174260 RepID=A0A9X0D466_9CNID|nr:hypothetical protein OS493_022837 [Desmophyllum pertusum]